MKKYFISIPPSNSPKELVLKDENTLIFNEKQYVFEFIKVYDNVYVFRINNRNFTVSVEKNEEENEVKNTNFVVELNGIDYNVKCQNEMDILVENFSKSKGSGKIKTDIVAPMPGSIVKIGVQEGQFVKRGQVLIVLEAMKMENELKAPMDCTVKKIFVEEKKAVEKNQLLLKLEPLQ
jgi:biotin carboxyl carrier protein